jgi:hypothetical protein
MIRYEDYPFTFGETKEIILKKSYLERYLFGFWVAYVDKFGDDRGDIQTLNQIVAVARAGCPSSKVNDEEFVADFVDRIIEDVLHSNLPV